MTKFTPLIIDGQDRPASDGATFKVQHPYSGEVVGTSASASSDDCKAAVDSAARAFKTWEHVSLTEKRDIFLKAAEIVKAEKYKLKIMESMEQETASADYWSISNWMATSNFLRTQAGLIDQLKGQVFPSSVIPSTQILCQRRAMGVIFAIAPWNAPFTLSIRAIAVPLLCGNTVVLKSSEYSPRSQAIVVELFQEAGLPAGVLNYISMSRETAPTLTAEIIAHPQVRTINFTGSDRIGRIIATEAAKYLKPCVLELGGKAPTVILDDADVKEAAKAITFGAMVHSGQVCMSTERVIVQSGIADKLMDSVHDLCKELKAGGNPLANSSVRLGALFTEGSATNVLSMLLDAKEAGAEVILGDLKREGAVIQPHLVKCVRPGMRLWDRESFGPVAVFAVADTVDQAIELANSSEYSLSAALWTSNVYAGQKIASRIRAGYVNINGSTFHSEPTSGLLGLGGASGYGRFAIENFTDARVIAIHEPGRAYPLFD